MQALSKKLERIPGINDYCCNWVLASIQEMIDQTDIEAAKNNDGSPLSQMGVFGFSVAFASGIFLYPCIGDDLHNRLLSLFTLFFTILFAFGSYCWIKFGVRNIKQTRVRKKELFAKLQADPVYVRGQDIIAAAEEHWMHCRRYRAWYEAVENDQLPEPAEQAEKYLAYLQRAHQTISDSAHNFLSAVRQTKDRKRFQEEHPVIITAPPNTALANLASTDGMPIEPPPAFFLEHQESILDDETSLARISEDKKEQPPEYVRSALAEIDKRK